MVQLLPSPVAPNKAQCRLKRRSGVRFTAVSVADGSKPNSRTSGLLGKPPRCAERRMRISEHRTVNMQRNIQSRSRESQLLSGRCDFGEGLGFFSTRLCLLGLGVRAQEFPEGPAVVRTDGCELYPNSLASFRPSHRSYRLYSGQLRRPTEHHPVLSADGEGLFRTEAQTIFAQVLCLNEIVSFPCRNHDAKRNLEPRSLPPFSHAPCFGPTPQADPLGVLAFRLPNTKHARRTGDISPAFCQMRVIFFRQPVARSRPKPSQFYRPYVKKRHLSVAKIQSGCRINKLDIPVWGVCSGRNTPPCALGTG